MKNKVPALLIVIMFLSGAFALKSCYKLRGHYGGPKSFEAVERPLNPKDVALPAGYKIEVVATGLTYPTGIAFDEAGTPYVTEAGYSYGEIWTAPKLLRLDAGGKATEIAAGGKNGPWNGVYFHNGAFYVAEGGELEGGKILKITKEGTVSVLTQNLPSIGDHHTNGPVVSSDGYIYFGQGTATNTGVVGPDNYEFGWLKRHPEFHDIPCKDITLVGKNFRSDNPLTEAKGDETETGAFVAFGTQTTPGQVIKGAVPCTGAIMRIPLAGGQPELVAWGLRNPFGLAFDSSGKLYITENANDTRGSRPGYGAGDVLWRIENGTWYGWPDYTAGKPMNTEEYETPKQDPDFILKDHPGKPPKPAAVLGVHSSSNGLDFSRNAAFGYQGQAFIAQFGDMAPNVGRIYGPVGFKVVRVDVNKGTIEDFAVNKGRVNGPASEIGAGGLERPVAVRFAPNGKSLYVVDFAKMPITEQGPAPKQKTGVVWKISREDGR